MDESARAPAYGRQEVTDVSNAPARNEHEQVSGATPDGLVVAVERIAVARSRGAQPSDGGSTGKTDMNDG